MEKKNYVIVSFHTTAEAMQTEEICHQRNFPGKLISAPREFSADCGIAWRGPWESRDQLIQALTEENVDYAGIHQYIF